MVVALSDKSLSVSPSLMENRDVASVTMLGEKTLFFSDLEFGDSSLGIVGELREVSQKRSDGDRIEL